VIDDVPSFYKEKSVHTTWASLQNAARAIAFCIEPRFAFSQNKVLQNSLPEKFDWFDLQRTVCI
jgi:hypothetical protein